MHAWPVLVHSCASCGDNTPVPYSPSVWKQEHLCSHCGTTSPGADIAGTSANTSSSSSTGVRASAGIMNTTQQDELARLFAQNMHLSQAASPQPPYSSPHSSPPPSLPVVEQQPPHQQPSGPRQGEKAAAAAEPIYFISSHYTPTAHIRPDTTSEPSSHPSPPSDHDALSPDLVAETLRQHAIDPSALLPNQIHLFQNADREQRLRLLELWRIAPPSYPHDGHGAPGKWAPTSVEKEEADARARYEQQQQQQQEVQIDTQDRVPPPEEQLMVDRPSMAMDEPISPIREPGEPAWPPAARMRAASIAAASHRNSPAHMDAAEPYMASGYQTDNQPAPSQDPVYGAAPHLWQSPSYAQVLQRQQQQMQECQQPQEMQWREEQQLIASMEQQYSYDSIRNYADWRAMEDRIAIERFIKQAPENMQMMT